MSTLYRFIFRRQGRTWRTLWSDLSSTQSRMARLIGPFRQPGCLSQDPPAAEDGSHPGVPRAGGILSLESKHR